MSGSVPDGQMRAGDADREAVAQVLHDALGAGRLDLTEVEERLTAVYAARTYAELEVVVADLPDVALPWRAPAVPAPDESPLRLNAGMSTQKRGGAWRVPRSIVAEPALADVYLDFREAVCPHARVDVEMKGGMGSLVLIVPEDWSVDTDGVDSGWGSVRNKRGSPPAPGRPTIVVTGKTGIGTLKARGAYFYE